MRSRRSRRFPLHLLVLALVAVAAPLYAVNVDVQRELLRAQTGVLAQNSGGAESLAVQEAPTQTPEPTPAPQTPQAALTTALDGLVDLMRAPRADLPAALRRHAEAALIEAFQREIEHLRVNNLRLSERSGFELLAVQPLAADGPRQARLLTEERWVYEEQAPNGRVVRCLVELSRQRYELEQRDDHWVVVGITLVEVPQRRPCTDAASAGDH